MIAPLDWGLGHTTRCIPVIRMLLAKGCRITLAAEGAPAVLLQSNFPNIPLIPLAGYRITYSRHAGTFAAKIIAQIPKIIQAIRNERKWLIAAHREHHFDLVISDNRYGLKINGLTSVILTHQLQVQSGKGLLIDTVLRKLHYPMLEKFDHCWIVDTDGKENLAGALSHPLQLPRNARYIGWLSQLKKPEETHRADPNHILVLLSGPEPMRGQLESLIMSQIENLNEYSFTVVAGNPNSQLPVRVPPHVVYYTHLNAAQLDVEMVRATLVICRSGYSTLMDLAVTVKKALLIPTPGQPEQEYLAGYLSEKGLAYSKKQQDLILSSDISAALKMPGINLKSATTSTQALEEAVDSALRF